MTQSPRRTLLEAVQHLHGWGYESIRVHAYRYATGHWRCELGAIGSPLRGGVQEFAYTSASEWDFFRDGETTPVEAEQLARRMLQDLPGLAALRAPATAYTVWYSTLLDYCGPNGTFILSEDNGYDALRAGYVQLLYPIADHTDGNHKAHFPLAPLF